MIKRLLPRLPRPERRASRIDLGAPASVELPRTTRREDWRVHLVDTGLRHDDRRPRQAAASRWLERRHVHADLRRRRLRRRRRARCSRSTARTASSRRSPPSARRRASAACVFDGDRVAEFTEKPQIGEGWINGGFFVFEPEVFDYLDGDETRPRSASRSSGWPPSGQLVAYRHDGFWQCMDTLRESSCLDELWAGGAGALEGLGMTHRASGATGPTFVTGATGLVGGWLVRRLLERGRRRRLPGPRLGAAERAGPRAACSTGSTSCAATSATRRCSSARSASTRSTPSSTSRRRRSSASPTATRSRPSRPTSRGTWALLEACRRSPPVKQIVVASSDKAYGDHDALPYDEDDAARRAAIPTTSASRAPT